MDLSSYSNEKLLMIINQSYNFEKKVLTEVCSETLKRELLSVKRLKEILRKNEVIRIKKKENQDDLDIEPKSVEFKKHSFFNFWFHRILESFRNDKRFRTKNPRDRFDLSKKRRFKRYYNNED